jgi:branched-chain amino acid transport system ATP-binding protein
MTVTLLEIDDLHVSYGKAEALKGISLRVPSDSVVAIVGANGAGKTTLLRSVSGLKRAEAGSIRFDGRQLDKLAPHRIAELGIAHIPEGRMVFAPMSVEDNLRMGAYLRKDRAQIGKDIESMFGLFPILRAKRSDPAGSLSGGQQQMLAVARALMSRPRMILMDEPSIGLSPIMVQEVGQIIRDVHSRGTGIVLVEQNARMALRLASQAYILELGSVILEGDARQLANDQRVKECYLGAAPEEPAASM